MADKIKLLPEVVANQIAAGEVVNRPSSVVKEMMENALDAGATEIKVNFRDGGKELIQIADNGCGMSPIDARMAFDRHATSKIASVEDIYALHTFGFRGEALASIAAVAQVELRTRQEGDEMGTQTEINGGQFVSQKPVLCSVGSHFYVRNLFYNVPARRRFLEKSTTSASQIKTEFQRVALCNPQVSFELYANDAPTLTLRATSLAGRIVDVVGRHIKQNLLEVAADTSIAQIAGYVGRPAAAKRRNTEQYLFVNGRYFRSPYLQSAILRAYEKLIPANSQPSYFLYLTLDPARIDVNVHPQKTEVRFADEEAVWQILHAAVRESLAKTGAVPLMDFDRNETMEIPVLRRGAVYSEPASTSNSDYNPFRETYIDPSAPDPNDNFRGFDVPYFDTDTDPDSDSDSGVPRRTAQGASRTGSARSARSKATFDGRGEFDLSADSRTPGNHDDRSGYNDHNGRSDEYDEYEGGLDEYEDFASGEGTFDLAEAATPGNAKSAAVRDLNGTNGAHDTQGAKRTAGPNPTNPPVSMDSTEAGAAKNSGAADAADDGLTESVLDFIPSEEGAEQQQLDLASGAVSFSDPVPLAGGLIVARMAGRLVVVDVRRARERLYYEECLRMLGSGSSVSQQLLFPERLELSSDEYALVEEHAVELATLGFDLELCGKNTVEVKGSPADVPVDEMDRLLFSLLQAFSMPVSLTDVRREKVAETMARAACRGACPTLTSDEAAVLLERLAASGNFSFSPSGRPILAEITPEELRAKLG